VAAIVPARHQPPLPLDRLIRAEPPADERLEMDVVFVGAGPAGLSGAIELARLAKEDAAKGGGLGEIQIAVLEKAGELGQHSLSGAVVNPRAFRTLFPGIADADLPFRAPVDKERVYFLTEKRALRIPVPPPMKNHGNFVASICEVVRFLGKKAEEAGVNVFTGYPVESLLVETMDGERVIGVRTAATGLKRDGTPGSGFTPGTDVTAKVVALSEGTRGSLSQAWAKWRGVTSPNPQIFALGVKELWETKVPLDSIVHTLGWPLPRTAFGGTFMYPLQPNLVALGIVVGLDYPQAGLDVHGLLQRLKTHPKFRAILEGGEMVEWGAKTIPEGGFHSLPARRHGDGIVMLGDAAGFVDVPSLKGIHYAMESGIAAARAIFAALKAGDTSAARLRAYDEAMDASYVMDDLRRRRNMRLAFKRGFLTGGFDATLMTLTKGAFPGDKIDTEEDAAAPREPGGPEVLAPDGRLTFSKTDGVFRSGNVTRDDVPPHLIVGTDVPSEVADFYSHVCPANVYERRGDHLVVNAPNCVDCKATDVLGPRWTPREGGSGPQYKRM
jgi:electron-transferring-flavoprotein dehydrogenase